MWLGHVPGPDAIGPCRCSRSGAFDPLLPTAGTPVTDWARQMVMQLRRWLPHRPLVLVGDTAMPAGFAPLLKPVTLILRLDAALYAPAPPRQPGQNGRPPLKGPRRPPLKVFLEQTDVTWASAEVAWYDGSILVTTNLPFDEWTDGGWYRSGKPQKGSPTRRRTRPRSWNGLYALATGGHLRATPVVRSRHRARPTGTLLLDHPDALQKRHPMTQRKAAWYDKPSPTFVDAIALARRTCGWRRKVSHCRSLTPTFTTVALYHRETCRFPCLRRLNCVKPSLGLGLAAGQRGLSVGFTTAAALVNELMEARDERRLLNLAATGPPPAPYHRRVGLRSPVPHRSGTALRGLQPALRTGLHPGDHQPALRRVDRGLRVRKAHRRAAGPSHPPRAHPGDERRELPPQGQPAKRRRAIVSAGSGGCRLASRRYPSRPRRQGGGPPHRPGRGRQAPPRWYSFTPPQWHVFSPPLTPGWPPTQRLTAATLATS